MNKIMIS